MSNFTFDSEADAGQIHPVYQSYSEYVRYLQSDWPEFAWLSRFLHTRVSTTESTTTVGVYDVAQDRVSYHDYSKNIESLGRALDVTPEGSWLRIVILTH